MTYNDTHSRADVDEDERSPGARKIAAAVAIAAIVALGLFLAVSNLLGDDPQPTPPAAAAPTPQTTAPSPTSEASVCGLTAVEMTGTVNAAPVTTWTLVGTTAAPAVEDHGPGTIDADGFRSCYARTPTGALVAAANYAAIGSYAPLRQRFYEEATVPGPGRDVLLSKPTTGASAGGVRVQIAGFRVLRYDGDQADVDLAFLTSKGAIGAGVVNLQWSGGDWKIRVAEDGSELSPAVQLPSLAGYIPWAGA